MPTYVNLISWTDQGVKNFKDTVSRAKEAEDAMAKLGVSITSIYWTLGPHDIVVISEAQDDESATAALLALCSQGNLRTTTMRAFSAAEMEGIIQKLG